jgi:SAM-dependent methyltransferase
VTARDLLFAVGAGALMAAIIGIPRLDPRLQFVAASVIACGVLSQSRQPLRFALMIGALLTASAITAPTFGTVLHAERTFFGSYHVGEKRDAGFRALYHGTTLHGMQWLDPARQHEPLSYYHRSGPVGQAFERIARLREATDIGVVGLGAGSLAAYAREFQRWTFYEIDPAVERIARDARYFTFLETCGVRCQVVLGDARLSLARSSARFDGIVLDAFSSDAIPVHLLTREAFMLYLERLKPGGVLVFHVSNRYLRLAPVLARLAADRGLTTFEEIRTRAAQADRTTDGESSSDWVVASADPGALVALATDPRWTLVTPPPGTPLWTDDFSNILAVLR